jgi:predicted dehydrogenase
MRQADQHFAIVRDCLQAGAHVYCEKPFVTAPDEADELLSLAKARHLKVAVGHTLRMSPMFARLKQGLAEGLIGEVAQIRAFGKEDARAGGEDMMVLGSHLFDLMRLYAGDPVACSATVLQGGRRIHQEDRRLAKDNVGYVAGDEVFAQFEFNGGVNATFTSTAKLRQTLGPWGMEILGSKGAARINCDLTPNIFLNRSSAWTSGEGQKEEWLPMHVTDVAAPIPKNSGPVGDWLESIAQDREPECSERNGAWAVEMVCAVYRSTLEGRRISFPLQGRKHPLA